MQRKFFHEEEKFSGLHMVKVFNDNHEPVLFGLDNLGYKGKIIICPGCENDITEAAKEYLKSKFSDISWE